jgi:hypothetical protein
MVVAVDHVVERVLAGTPSAFVICRSFVLGLPAVPLVPRAARCRGGNLTVCFYPVAGISNRDGLIR